MKETSINKIKRRSKALLAYLNENGRDIYQENELIDKKASNLSKSDRLLVKIIIKLYE